jgi:hypothetical protein
MKIAKIAFSFFMLSSSVCAQQYKSLKNVWENIDYNGNAWVENISKPIKISQGLKDRHISLWASHGAIYDNDKNEWRWQRPNLFCTTEDLFTQTIVVPFLIPMLENAGAIVFTPRERDWQTNEVIVDNDDKNSGPKYFEYNGRRDWQDAPEKGFAQHEGNYSDGENPFEEGTLRYAKTTKSKHPSLISYQPNFPDNGHYAVYISYKSLPESVDDAQYIVYHKGQSTEFKVNQQIGGGTWVYLGTFDFDKGCNEFNRVIITNKSHHKGVVSADAVRFGGGMGNIMRGGYTSRLPRCLEGSRYYAQWAGAPFTVYSSKNGVDDYADDINSRSLMTNWLAGGSAFVPALDGLGVPIELSLAVHSDAGYSFDGKSIIGSLAICTTDNNDGVLNSGVTRMTSKQFADDLLTNLYNDISYRYGSWARRYLWDRNYSETRMPEMPSAIIETLSHQNFPDISRAQDPNFKFTIARSLYKTILKFIQRQHNCSYTVQPLPPKAFKIEFKSGNKVSLLWMPQNDGHEATAKPSSYNIYTAIGKSGFDNGINVESNHYETELEPGKIYSFKVTACNRGGESFPTQVLCAMVQPNAKATVMIVDGFERLSSPAVINNDTQQGFDISADPGVSYNLATGWSGKQIVFDKSKMGLINSSGLGYSGNEMEGKFIMGNTFDYTVDHAMAIASTGRFNIVSCSKASIENESVDLSRYKCVDIFFGLQKNAPYNLEYYKTFTDKLQKKIRSYVQKSGNLIVSGAYIGADMNNSYEQNFLNDVLKVKYDNSVDTTANDTINGLNMKFEIYKKLNPKHYSVTKSDILSPSEGAICAMQYSDGSSAAVAYNGAGYKCFTMGFPFECITNSENKNKIMAGILKYVLP